MVDLGIYNDMECSKTNVNHAVRLNEKSVRLDRLMNICRYNWLVMVFDQVFHIGYVRIVGVNNPMNLSFQLK